MAGNQAWAACAQTYSCQATELLNCTTPLNWWDVGQDIKTDRSGNASLGQLLRGFFYLAYYYGTLPNWRSIGRPGRWFYDNRPETRLPCSTTSPYSASRPRVPAWTWVHPFAQARSRFCRANEIGRAHV